MWNNQKQLKVVLSYVKLTNLLPFKPDLKRDQNTEGNWLVHDTKRREDNQLQSLEFPVEWKHDIKESKWNMFNPTFKGNVQGQKHLGSCAFAEPELLM